MGDWVYFSFYDKKKLNEYDCTNYKIPSNVFYNLLKENKSEGVRGYSKCIINNKKISYNQFSEELRDILIA